MSRSGRGRGWAMAGFVCATLVGCGRLGYAPSGFDAGIDGGGGSVDAGATLDAPDPSGDAAAPDDGATRDAESDSSALDGSSSRLRITSPNLGEDFMTRQQTVVISGECSPDVTGLLANRSMFADADCSDGTFSLMPFEIEAINASSSHTFRIDGDSGAGPLFDEIEIRYEAVIRIVVPSRFTSISTREPSVVVTGACVPDAVELMTSVGTFSDADCSDGTFALDRLTLDVPVGLVITARDAAGTLGVDRLTITRDVAAPGFPTFMRVDPPSGSDDNFPTVYGTAEPGASVMIYADSTCTVMLGRQTDADFAAEGVMIAVEDNTTTSLYARVQDAAGNTSVCFGFGAAYEEVTPFVAPVDCDETASGTMTFVEFQALLELAESRRATHLADDGHISVCFAPGTVVTTTESAEGSQLTIPGDGFYLRVPTGGAQLVNRRVDGTASAPQSALSLGTARNVSIDGLEIETLGGDGVGIELTTASGLRLLRRVTIGTSGATADALWLRGRALVIEELTARVLGNGATAIKGFGDAFVGAIRNAVLVGGRYGVARGSTGMEPFVVGEILDTEISMLTSTGIGIDLANMQLLAMTGTSLRQIGAAGARGTAIAFHHYDPSEGFRPFVRTGAFRDNVVCGVGDARWRRLLVAEDGGVEHITPTVPGGDVTGPYGALTVPWGDSGDAASNPGFNQQAMWGGVCP